MRYKLAIFDCDGVLFDSRRANYAYYNQILKFMGKSAMTEDQFFYVHMHTAQKALNYLFPGEEEFRCAVEYASKLDYSQFISFMEMEPGVLETLNTIRRLSVKTAVSTNRSTTMPKLIEVFDLNRWFDMIVCALDVEKPKPDPEGVFKILNYFFEQKNNAIYIGDSKVDEEVARRSGLPFVAYKNEELDAKFHVKHFSEIKDIILDS